MKHCDTCRCFEPPPDFTKLRGTTHRRPQHSESDGAEQVQPHLPNQTRLTWDCIAAADEQGRDSVTIADAHDLNLSSIKRRITDLIEYGVVEVIPGVKRNNCMVVRLSAYGRKCYPYVEFDGDAHAHA